MRLNAPMSRESRIMDRFLETVPAMDAENFSQMRGTHPVVWVQSDRGSSTEFRVTFSVEHCGTVYKPDNTVSTVDGGIALHEHSEPILVIGDYGVATLFLTTDQLDSLNKYGVLRLTD